MNPITIRKEIEIAAPASQVWRYIGTAAGLCQWWGVDLTLEARPGGYCEERGVRDGQPYRLTGEVTVYEPPHRLALRMRPRVAHEGWPACTQLEITLAETANRTKVLIVHHAFVAELVPSAISLVTAPGNPVSGPLMALPGACSRTNPLLLPQLLAGFQALQNWQPAQAASWQRRIVILQTLMATHVEQELCV